MSTRTIEMFQACCDKCGKVYEESVDGTVAWIDSEQAVIVATEIGDWHRSLLDANKLFCYDCYSDQNEELHD
jgi:hypothetical protein